MLKIRYILYDHIRKQVSRINQFMVTSGKIPYIHHSTPAGLDVWIGVKYWSSVIHIQTPGHLPTVLSTPKLSFVSCWLTLVCVAIWVYSTEQLLIRQEKHWQVIARSRTDEWLHVFLVRLFCVCRTLKQININVNWVLLANTQVLVF